MINILGEIVWFLRENIGKIIGYPLVAIGLFALAVVFPYILILYCLALGGYLIKDE